MMMCKCGCHRVCRCLVLIEIGAAVSLTHPRNSIDGVLWPWGSPLRKKIRFCDSVMGFFI